MSEQGPSTAEAAKVIEVVRDSTFVRFVADEAVLIDLGRDFDVAFLQYGSILVSQTAMGDDERTDQKNVVTEVARMRMGQNEFLALVMNYVRSGILEGRLKGDAVRQSIGEWIEEARSGSRVPADDAQ